ncbi:MAG: hypothetical protein KatS3mg069_0665 [Meiothermus sp.]|nr:MAG: hypothetical protein KatS3mg069_0665 [Meiothermus sp.]
MCSRIQKDSLWVFGFEEYLFESGIKTEAVWSRVRDGEGWTYRRGAFPYLPQTMQAFGQSKPSAWSGGWCKATGKVRRSVSYALTSLGTEVVFVGRGEIENASFWVWGVLLKEDA